MVSTFTPNINFEEPARGDQVGTWDTPVNNNETVADLVLGGSVTIGLNNAPVVLASAQFQAASITFNSTLTGSVAITFPSTFKKGYTIRHNCTGSSAFVITMQTTVAGGQAIACRPGNPFQCWNDGTNLYFVNLGTEVGGYWDFAGSSVPAWVSGCTVPPYLNCDGTAFSSATYPQLAVILAGTTLPDSRGRFRAVLNQTTGRLTSSQGGLDGNTILASSGFQTTTLVTANLPPYTPSGVLNSTPGGTARGLLQLTAGPVQFGGTGSGGNTTNISSANTFFTGDAQGGTSTPIANVPPAYVGGLTLIRSA